MGAFDTRELLQAASASLAEGPAGPAPGRRRAVPIAGGVAEISMQPSYSPVLLVGMVRGVEFVLVTLTGFLVHAFYLASKVPFHWGYGIAVVGLAALTVAVFQASGAYGVGAFRAFFNFGVRIVAGWLLVPGRARGRVLPQNRRQFFARMAGELVRARPREDPGRTAGPFVRRVELHAKRPPRSPHRDRRRRRGGGNHDPGARRPAGERRVHRRPVRRPGHGALARRGRRLSEARHRGRSRRLRPAHEARPRGVHAADLGRAPHFANAGEALDPADRHPALGAHEQAAPAPAQLFLHRHRAGARRGRQADRRLGPRPQVDVRQNRRVGPPDPALADPDRRGG